MALDDVKEKARQLALSDLEHFIRIVHPLRLLGGVHKELISWWTREDAKSHQLVLLPRDHMKSALIAYRIAWEITKNPAIRVLYLSSTITLAGKQIKFIKDILLSERYRDLWPDMINLEEAKREKWTELEFSVDHPDRKKESIRDATVFTAGLKKSITGLHCDIAVLDDIVVIENAYTEEGREKIKTQYSLLSSIETSDAREWVVGTRYHPLDLYNDLISKEVEIYGSDGDLKEKFPLYEVFERKVEDSLEGDGSGQFLWPRQQRKDGKWFGFDAGILAKKKAQYLDKTQFRAQYYNDPNDAADAAIDRDLFQYYDPQNLKRIGGKWFYKGERLNLFASVDFAFSLNTKADFTAICVVGVDKNNFYYILEIDRFKTDKISEYFSHIMNLHKKWDFRKLRAEITAAQKVIVKNLKEDYIRTYGLALVIDDYLPTRHQGRKEERINACLQPRYANRQIFHYRAGNCQILEEELVLRHPPHDDVKDALASCIEICVPPSSGVGRNEQMKMVSQLSNNRFGGIRF